MITPIQHTHALQPDAPNVLVAEDEVLIRLVLADQLRSAGFLVFEGCNSAEAIAILRANDAIALVISDVRMPGEMDGFALSRFIKAHYPEIKIILASAHLPSPSEMTHLDGFFRKPYDAEAVVRSAERLLNRAAEASAT